MIIIRVPGVSNGNNGYAEFRLNGTSVGQCWSNNANGYHNMIHFNEVMELKEGDKIQLFLANLSYSYNLGNPLATSLTLIKM